MKSTQLNLRKTWIDQTLGTAIRLLEVNLDTIAQEIAIEAEMADATPRERESFFPAHIYLLMTAHEGAQKRLEEIKDLLGEKAGEQQ